MKDDWIKYLLVFAAGIGIGAYILQPKIRESGAEQKNAFEEEKDQIAERMHSYLNDISPEAEDSEIGNIVLSIMGMEPIEQNPADG